MSSTDGSETCLRETNNNCYKERGKELFQKRQTEGDIAKFWLLKTWVRLMTGLRVNWKMSVKRENMIWNKNYRLWIKGSRLWSMI